MPHTSARSWSSKMTRMFGFLPPPGKRFPEQQGRATVAAPAAAVFRNVLRSMCFLSNWTGSVVFEVVFVVFIFVASIIFEDEITGDYPGFPNPGRKIIPPPMRAVKLAFYCTPNGKVRGDQFVYIFFSFFCFRFSFRVCLAFF